MRWARWLVIVGIYLWLYLPTLSFDYTYLDDQYITTRAEFYSDKRNILKIFSQDVFSEPGAPPIFYRPILSMSYFIDAALWKTQLMGYHLTNIVLGLIMLFSFAWMCRLWTGENVSVWIMTGIFSVHPALTQAVAWIPGRNDILLAIWTFLALGCLRGKRYGWHLIFVWLALFTKESGVWLPLVLGIYVGRRSMPTGWLRVGYVIGLISYGFIRSHVMLPVDMSYMIQETGRNLPGLAMYIYKLILPTQLSVTPVLVDFPRILLGWMFGLIIALGLWRKPYLRDRSMWFAILLGSLFFAILPVDKANQYHLFLEQRLVIPLAVWLMYLSSFMNRPRQLVIPGIITILIYGWLSYRHIPNFSGFEAFWQNSAKTAPSAALSAASLGTIYYRQGKLDLAEQYLLVALTKYSEQAYVNANLGAVYLEKGELGKAAYFLDQELRTRRYDDALFSRGVVAFNQEDYELAGNLWQEAITYNPHHKQTLKSLAQLYYMVNEKNSGYPYYKRAVDSGMAFTKLIEEFYE